jgi:hypothetical protein
MKPEREAPETSNSLKLPENKNVECRFTPEQMSLKDDAEMSTFLRVIFEESFRFFFKKILKKQSDICLENKGEQSERNYRRCSELQITTLNHLGLQFLPIIRTKITIIEEKCYMYLFIGDDQNN